ncbi:hypothetical protein M514_04804 [Trichuris suis]|uniref:DUF7107 domain-containing protein n=1 Tax=Trichuris suis TaxID=68888 RepID=A0A085NUN8_9BILA|nr:hypothetical protein M513_04804 [Trichuris suis]KFD73184.1 hypothetical protein M514_04804 [Trichuris suis]KHJ45577.1 hypothetical protein D918_04314 [Trichuris suis]
MLFVLSIIAVAILERAIACIDHSDCRGQQMCYRRRCVPAKPAGGMCNTDEQCETDLGQACISGICMVPAVKPPYPTIECLTDDECFGQRLCVDLQCVAAVSTDRMCDEYTRCPPGQRCRYGACWIPYQPPCG